MKDAPRSWTRFLPLVKWPIAIGIIVFLIYSNRDNFQALQERPIQWEFLILGVVLCVSSTMATFVRWYLLVWAQNFPFRLRDAIRLGFLGCMFNYVAPGSLGGDVVKMGVLLNHHKERRLIAASTVILDRVLGLVALMTVGAAASFFAPDGIQNRQQIDQALWTGAIGGGGLLLWLMHPASANSALVRWLIRLPKVGPVFADIANSIALYQERRLVILLGILIGVVGQFGVISSFYFCARAICDVSQVPSYITHILLIPLAEFVSVIFPTPGGMGALELAVQQSYEAAGADPAMGLIAALVYRMAAIFVACIGGVYYAISRAEIAQAVTEDAADGLPQANA